MSARGHELALAATALLMTVPFASKAFHIDDAAYVELAEGGTALDERDRAVFAGEARPPDAYEAMSHPPLVPALITAGARLAGGVREVPQHLVFAAFPALAAVSLYRLAARLTPDPLWPALLVATSPVFVLSGQGLMTDMPMLALSLLSLAALAEGIGGGRSFWTLVSGVAAGLAILTRYVAFGLLPLLIVLELAQRRRVRAAAAAAAIAAVVAGAWAVHDLASHGTLHLLAAGRHYLRYYSGDAFTAHGTAMKALSDTAAVGGALLAPLLIAATDRPRAALVSLAAGGTVSFANPLRLPELQYYTAAQRTALALFLAAGVFALALALARARARPFLTIWLAGALISAVVVLPFGASRYVLPALAPLALLAFGSRPGRWAAAVALNVALSLALSIVDWSHAGAYRAFARSFHPAGRTWFVGEWGFRHYMRREGHHYLAATDLSPAAGDWIVRAELAGLHEIAPELRRRAPVTAVSEAESALPLRLMGFAAKAGFYSHAWGLLPYSASRAPLERFEIRRVAEGAS